MLPIFSALRNPKRRPRAIVWTAVGLMVFVILWAFGLGGTSVPWFCEEPCHIVHADNTLTYNAGSHSKVTCVACHEPVNADPITFTLEKISVLPDLYSTVTKTFELPLNPYNETAIEMPSASCTQCHNLATRHISPSRGIIIDHEAHSTRDISCTTCHNRVAHPEDDVTYTLPGDKKHDDWMRMDACFRCHGLQTGAKAPGACATCHTAAFKLTPASHETTSWYNGYGASSGHAKAAIAESASVAASLKHTETGEAENPGEKEPTLKPSSAVNGCYTCHKASFCSDCHGGLEMPHPATFKKTHGPAGFKNPALCAKCHARSKAEATGTEFCNACHHPASTPGGSWITEHPTTVRKDGSARCFECHDEPQCSYCHVNGVAAGRKALPKTFSR